MAGVKDAALGAGNRTNTNRGVSVKKLTDELESANRKINTLQSSKSKMAENASKAGTSLVQAAEVGASAAVGGFGVGMAGEKHNGVARVVRGIGGAGLLMWGLVDVLRGKNGSHQMALGEGLVAAEMAESGANLGRKLRGRWSSSPAAVPAAPVNGFAGHPGHVTAPAVAGPTVVMTPQISGPREVLPDEPDLEGFRQRGRVRASRAS